MDGSSLLRAALGPLVATLLSLPLAKALTRNSEPLLTPWRTTQVAPGPFPKPVEDPSGMRFTLGAPPGRIVSAVLAADELLHGLVDSDRIRGVTYLADDPGTSVLAGRVPLSVARVQGSIEPILALEPDLLIVAQYTDAGTVVSARALGVPVVRLGPASSFRDVQANLTLLGAATGCEERAARRSAAIDARLERARARAPRRSLRMVVWSHGRAEGTRTLVDDAIRAAGARNAVAELGLSGSVALSIEGLFELQPDVLISPAPIGEVRRGDPLLESDRVLSQLGAVRRGAIFRVPSAWIGSVSDAALRAVDALQTIASEVAP